MVQHNEIDCPNFVFVNVLSVVDISCVLVIFLRGIL